MADRNSTIARSGPGKNQGGESPEQLDPPASHDRSLTDDLVALLDDGKTYAEAELQFQKTRATFAFDKGKAGALYGLAALALLHLALVALAVGAVIALAPVLTAWGATALVAGLLALAGFAFALLARTRFARLADAYRETRE